MHNDKKKKKQRAKRNFCQHMTKQMWYIYTVEYFSTIKKRLLIGATSIHL